MKLITHFIQITFFTGALESRGILKSFNLHWQFIIECSEANKRDYTTHWQLCNIALTSKSVFIHSVVFINAFLRVIYLRVPFLNILIHQTTFHSILKPIDGKRKISLIQPNSFQPKLAQQRLHTINIIRHILISFIHFQRKSVHYTVVLVTVWLLNQFVPIT